jgi:hypothetical protein
MAGRDQPAGEGPGEHPAGWVGAINPGRDRPGRQGKSLDKPHSSRSKAPFPLSDQHVTNPGESPRLVRAVKDPQQRRRELGRGIKHEVSRAVRDVTVRSDEDRAIRLDAAKLEEVEFRNQAAIACYPICGNGRCVFQREGRGRVAPRLPVRACEEHEVTVEQFVVACDRARGRSAAEPGR